jgi:hypothetical protein
VVQASHETSGIFSQNFEPLGWSSVALMGRGHVTLNASRQEKLIREKTPSGKD